jgi:hypothetical protein
MERIQEANAIIEAKNAEIQSLKLDLQDNIDLKNALDHQLNAKFSKIQKLKANLKSVQKKLESDECILAAKCEAESQTISKSKRELRLQRSDGIYNCLNLAELESEIQALSLFATKLASKLSGQFQENIAPTPKDEMDAFLNRDSMSWLKEF